MIRFRSIYRRPNETDRTSKSKELMPDSQRSRSKGSPGSMTTQNRQPSRLQVRHCSIKSNVYIELRISGTPSTSSQAEARGKPASFTAALPDFTGGTGVRMENFKCCTQGSLEEPALRQLRNITFRHTASGLYKSNCSECVLPRGCNSPSPAKIPQNHQRGQSSSPW